LLQLGALWQFTGLAKQFDDAFIGSKRRSMLNSRSELRQVFAIPQVRW